MRVLHLTRDFPPRSAGGISTAVGGMVRALHRGAVACSVVSFDDWRPRGKRDAGSAVPCAAEFGAVLRVSAPTHLPAVHAFARAHAPDVLHVHHGMLWPVAEELRRSLSIPAVLEVHVLQAHQNRLRGIDAETLSSRAQQRAVSEADWVVAPSAAAARLITGDVPGAAQRIAIIGLGVELPAAAPSSGPRRREVLYVGRFADLNGTRELLEIVPGVLARVPGARFCIAGGLPHSRKAERRWLRRFDEAWTGAVRERVDVVGWLGDGALRDRYLAAGALVSPSWFESFGLVLLEAMACGTPIAATDVGAVPELIEHGRTGLLCAARHVDAMVDNVVRLLEERAWAETLGAAAQEVARDRSWDGIAAELASLYRSVTSRP